MSVDHRPALRSRNAALAAATFAALTALSDTFGVALAAAGLVGVAAGTVRASRSLVDGGAVTLAAGVAIAAASHSTVIVPLLGAVGAVLAWDLGEQAISLGEQLGREAETRRLELVHAGTTLAVGLAAAVAGFALYRIAFRGVTFATLVLLLVAALLLMLSLRE